MKKIAIRLLVLLVAAGVVAGGFYLVNQIPQEREELPLTPVRRGDLIVKTHLRGELQAVRSQSLTSPNLGSMTQITRLAPPGALASAGDLIVEFDDSERRAALEDAELEVARVKELLNKAETDLEIRKSQDDVELLKARFAVERAELEVKKNELISAIDARKNILTLEESKRREQKLQEDIKNRLQQREAELAVLREQLQKAQLEVDREKRRIAQSRLLSPMSGLVWIQQNRAGGRGGFGQTTPDIQEGDQIPPGMEVAKILDLSEMELLAKVEEVERANLHEEQEAVIRLDALPGKIVRGRVKNLGNTASLNVFRGEATKKFDVVLAIDMQQLLTNVGASPQQIDRILAKAEENASRGGASRRTAAGSRPPPAGERAGAAAGRRPGEGSGRQAAPGGQPGQQARTRGPGGRQGGGRGAGLTAEQRQRARQMMQQMLDGRDIQSLSQQERRQMFQQVRQRMGASGGGQGRPGGGPGGPAGAEAAGAPGGEGGFGGAPQLSMSLSQTGNQKFTAEERAKAQLPAPPSEGSDVDILLRPGLLADAEIIVDHIKDALYVPYQGVFEVNGNPVLYVWDGSRLEPRRVELGKRSESQIVVLSGVEEGDLISLEPPGDQTRRSRKKKQGAKKGAQPSFPGAGPPGGGGEGGRGRRR